MGTATFDDAPSPTTVVSVVTSSNFYIGYRDDLDRVSDLGISCLGIYNEIYSPALAERHGKQCSLTTKRNCPVAPGPYANSVQSGNIGTADKKLHYMCYNGYEWSGTNQPVEWITCTQSSGTMLPTL